MLYDEYESYVLGFHDLNKTKFALAGGKGAKVGELSRSEGIRAWGFYVTTRFLIGHPRFVSSKDEWLAFCVKFKIFDKNRAAWFIGYPFRRFERRVIGICFSIEPQLSVVSVYVTTTRHEDN